MGNYRLTADAKADLRRIYRYGFETHGEAAADEYYAALFDRFDQLAEQPLLYPAVNDIQTGYRRSVCGTDSIDYRIAGETVEIGYFCPNRHIGIFQGLPSRVLLDWNLDQCLNKGVHIDELWAPPELISTKEVDVLPRNRGDLFEQSRLWAILPRVLVSQQRR